MHGIQFNYFQLEGLDISFGEAISLIYEYRNISKHTNASANLSHISNDEVVPHEGIEWGGSVCPHWGEAWGAVPQQLQAKVGTLLRLLIKQKRGKL